MCRLKSFTQSFTRAPAGDFMAYYNQVCCTKCISMAWPLNMNAYRECSSILTQWRPFLLQCGCALENNVSGQMSFWHNSCLPVALYFHCTVHYLVLSCGAILFEFDFHITSTPEFPQKVARFHCYSCYNFSQQTLYHYYYRQETYRPRD